MNGWFQNSRKVRFIAALCAVSLTLATVSICNADAGYEEQDQSILKKTWNFCVKKPLLFLKRHNTIRRLLTLMAMGGMGYDGYREYTEGFKGFDNMNNIKAKIKKRWMGVAGAACLPILLAASAMDPFSGGTTITQGKQTITAVKGLQQSGLQCGYYALYHAWCMLRNAVPSQSEFHKSFDQYIHSYGENIDQTPMSEFILSKKELANALYKTYTFSSLNIHSMSKSLCENQIKAFNKKGKTQYFVLHLPGAAHWVAVKMEHKNKKKKEVKFTVVDSMGGSNPYSYKTELNKLHNLFCG